MQHDPAHQRRERQGAEPGPDDLADPGIAVNLGQDVAEQVADREEQTPAPNVKPPSVTRFGAEMKFEQIRTVTNAAMIRS